MRAPTAKRRLRRPVPLVGRQKLPRYQQEGAAGALSNQEGVTARCPCPEEGLVRASSNWHRIVGERDRRINTIENGLAITWWC
jgi:hypothetical protein